MDIGRGIGERAYVRSITYLIRTTTRVHFMKRLGFREARTRLRQALAVAAISFEGGDAREGKNLLQTGDVDREFVIQLLDRCQGGPDAFGATPHHYDRGTWVYVFKPRMQGIQWYVKAYFLVEDPSHPDFGAVVISVHTAGSKVG